MYVDNFIQLSVKFVTLNLVFDNQVALNFSYAFGFPPDSPYIDVINQALLKLQENSKLDTLWTALLANTGQCPPRPPTAQLTLQSLNGVFTTLAVGLVASVFALVGEYVYVTWCDVQGRTVGCPPDQVSLVVVQINDL